MLQEKIAPVYEQKISSLEIQFVISNNRYGQKIHIIRDNLKSWFRLDSSWQKDILAMSVMTLANGF